MTRQARKGATLTSEERRVKTSEKHVRVGEAKRKKRVPVFRICHRGGGRERVGASSWSRIGDFGAVHERKNGQIVTSA